MADELPARVRRVGGHRRDRLSAAVWIHLTGTDLKNRWKGLKPLMSSYIFVIPLRGILRSRIGPTFRSGL